MLLAPTLVPRRSPARRGKHRKQCRSQKLTTRSEPRAKDLLLAGHERGQTAGGTTEAGSSPRASLLFAGGRKSKISLEPCRSMAVIAQLVARRSHNPKVVSSILTHRMRLPGIVHSA